MAQLNPYLNFNGNTEEAFNFYRSVFGGEFAALMRFSDNATTAEVPEADRSKIMHIALPIGDGNMLMGTDAVESMGPNVSFGTNLYLCYGPDSREDADRIFNALSEGGKVEMPMSDMFWGDYFGSFTDKFGVLWMIVHSNKK